MPANAALAPWKVRRILRPAALAAGLAWAAAAPAQAALDADRIAADGQAMLDSYVKQSDGALKPQGKVTAVRDGDAVVVSVPPLLIENAEARVEVPGASLRLQETGDDRVGFVVTLPDRVTGTKAAPSKDTLLIELGGQKIDGVYRPSLLTFERLDMLLETVSIDTTDSSLSLAAARVKMASVETAAGKWRTDAALSLGELRVLGPDKAPIFSLGRLEQIRRLDQYDLPRIAAMQRELTGGNPFQAMSEPDQEKAAALAQSYFAQLPDLLAGASGGLGVRVADLRVTAPEEPPFSLGSASFDIGLAPDEALYGLQFAFAFDGPELHPAMAPVPPHLLPRRALAEAGLRKLPLAPIWAAISGPIQQAMALEMAGKMTPETEAQINQQMEMMPMAAMGMAAEAGSFAEIKAFELELGPAKLTARGIGPLMPGMPEPPLRIEATIEGLEELAAEVEKLDPEMREQAMPVLVMLRGLGKPAAQNNKVVHTYLIEQTPAGAITVNGVAMDKMGQK